MHAVVRPALELHLPVDQREDRVVATQANVVARLPLGAALAEDDVAGDHRLTTELFDAEQPPRGITTVARRATCFFVCHARLLLRSHFRIGLRGYVLWIFAGNNGQR